MEYLIQWRRFCCLALLFFSQPLQKDAKINWIAIWNVGQGQWVTWFYQGQCLHFDVGGERSQRLPRIGSCENKLNLFYFSHDDADHMNLLTQKTKNLSRVCIAAQPLVYRKITTWQIIQSYPRCHRKKLTKSVVEFPVGTNGVASSTVKNRFHNNSWSRVFWVNSHILIPGDSPIAQEKIWQRALDFKPPRIWILGHHGSRTSSGTDLIGKMNLRTQIICSSRKAKYGHPHSLTLKRLWLKKLKPLNTEQWGNIGIELNSAAYNL